MPLVTSLENNASSYGKQFPWMYGNEIMHKYMPLVSFHENNALSKQEAIPLDVDQEMYIITDETKEVI